MNSTTTSLYGDAGDDSIYFYPNFGFASVYDSAGANDLLDFTNFTNRLRFTISATEVNVTLGNAPLLVTHFGNTIERLVGSSDNDTFTFTDGATLVNRTGRIDGYGGTADLLNYAAYTTGITVTLEGAATGLANVTNIENVNGGSGDDVITGNTNGNVIIGERGQRHT